VKRAQLRADNEAVFTSRSFLFASVYQDALEMPCGLGSWTIVLPPRVGAVARNEAFLEGLIGEEARMFSAARRFTNAEPSPEPTPKTIAFSAPSMSVSLQLFGYGYACNFAQSDELST
jgi:hypothetical protein